MTQDTSIETAIEQVNAVLTGRLRAPHVKACRSVAPTCRS